MRRIIQLILALLLLGVALPASPEPPAITLTLTPQVGTTPLVVLAKISLAKSPHNRGLCIEWAQLLDGGLSCQTVDGEDFPVTTWKHITLRTGGEYLVVATVTRDDQSIKQSLPLTVHVLERF